MSLSDVVILAVCVLCFVKSLIIETKLLNKNLNIFMSACLPDILAPSKIVWLQSSSSEVRVLIFLLVSLCPKPEISAYVDKVADFFSKPLNYFLVEIIRYILIQPPPPPCIYLIFLSLPLTSD